MSSSLHMLLVMLFIHVGKRSNNRSQVFLKRGVLKNIHWKTPVLESLFNKVTRLKACIFLEKETPSQVFFCKNCKAF